MLYLLFENIIFPSLPVALYKRTFKGNMTNPGFSRIRVSPALLV